MAAQKLKTALAFTKNLLTTGALFETSKRVEREICTNLPEGDNKVVVEYGMGHGNITKEILKRLAPTSKLYAFEVNEEFCKYVSRTIDDPRLVIVNDGAQNLHKYVTDPIHGFVSSIPFTFFSKEMAASIIQSSYDALEEGYFFCQILYSKLHYKKFNTVFDDCYLRKFVGLPMEYIYHCRK
ncbi:MAG: hypothetical protein KJP00_07015 [Bacteroidia bacterium]|nr:hypothetical protein [Bacteroidia bacterium]